MGKPSQMERISRKEYELVREAQTESPDNEIRVKAYRRRFPYVAYIVKLLNEGKFESVNMIASGQAIQKLLDTVKLLRNRVSGVHCSLTVEVSKRVLRFEPREDFKETKEPIEKTRMRMSMKAVISSKALEEITSSSGYLPPMDDSELLKPEEFQNIVKEYNEKEKNQEEKEKVNPEEEEEEAEAEEEEEEVEEEVEEEEEIEIDKMEEVDLEEEIEEMKTTIEMTQEMNMKEEEEETEEEKEIEEMTSSIMDTREEVVKAEEEEEEDEDDEGVTMTKRDK